MELRIRSHLPLHSGTVGLGLAVLLGVLVALLWTSDSRAAGGAKAPTVSSVSPSKAVVGQRLTIRGRNFRAGKGRNTVIFRRDGGRALFVRADLSTRKLIRVTVPARLEPLLPLRDGARQYAHFRVRVLAGKLGRSFTPLSRSPRLGMPVAADGDCDRDGRTNRVDDDDDNDLLPDVTEAKLRTDVCALDTDGDGAGDGYEFQSALDLNDDEYQEPNLSLPHPEKRPYPNALYADAHLDFDGDGLTLGEEHKLWREQGNPQAGLSALNYSDGLQYSVYAHYEGNRRRGTIAAAGYDKHGQFLAWATATGYLTVKLPDGVFYDIRDFNRSGGAPSAAADKETVLTPEVYYNSERYYYDFDEDGLLSDDERDEDADGLTNYDESHGRLRPEFWTGCYGKEAPYPIAYAGTDLADADSDNDGVLDGADDQDHDDIPNIMEMSRNAASGRSIVSTCDDKGAIESTTPSRGWVNPFNPCLPDTSSRTCARHPNLGALFAPFDPQGKRYHVLN